MPASESIAAMLGELAAMSPEDRAVILDALSRKERSLLDQLGRAISTGQPSHTGLSPWLATHVDGARRGDGAMTAATREALLRIVSAPARERLPTGRSLAGAFGGLLATRGGR